jgi:ribonuclease HI
MATYKCTFDGCAEPNPGTMGCGWTINNESCSRSPGKGTNNEAEYHALLNLLVALLDQVQSGDSVEIRGDSEVIIKQINREYKVRAPNLQPLWEQANAHMMQLRERGCAVSLHWHRREENTLADAASKRAIGINPEAENAFCVPAETKVKMIALEGRNTFQHRETIKSAGGKWDPLREVWRVPETEHRWLTQLVESE